MKTKVSIELDENDRDVLANLIDQNDTKRLASRNDIVSLCEQHIGGLVSMGQAWTFEEEQDEADDERYASDLYDIDDGDRPMMGSPDDPSYVRGWNQVKRSKK